MRGGGDRTLSFIEWSTVFLLAACGAAFAVLLTAGDGAYLPFLAAAGPPLAAAMACAAAAAVLTAADAANLLRGRRRR